MSDTWSNALPGERDLFGVDFGAELDARGTGLTIVGQATWAAIPPAGISIETATRTTGGRVASVWISTPYAGEWTINVAVVTSGGHRLESDLFLTVEGPAAVTGSAWPELPSASLNTPGIARIQWYSPDAAPGARFDGTGDDAAAWQWAVDQARAEAFRGGVQAPNKASRLTGMVECHPTQRFILDWQGATVINARRGNGRLVLFRATDPIVPIAGRYTGPDFQPRPEGGLHFEGAPWFRCEPGIDGPNATHFEYRFSAGLTGNAQFFMEHFAGNSCWRQSGSYNTIQPRNSMFWGGGARNPLWRVETGTARYAIPAGGNAWTLSGAGAVPVPAGAVGRKVLLCQPGAFVRAGQIFTVATVAGGGMSGTFLEQSEQPMASAVAQWDVVRASISAGTDVLNIEAGAFTFRPTDKGHRLDVPRAGTWPVGSSVSMLETFIADYISPTQVRLDRVADNPATLVPLMWSPAVDLMGEGPGDETNDLEVEGLLIEIPVGRGLHVGSGQTLRMDGGKIHPQMATSFSTTPCAPENTCSFLATFNNFSGVIISDTAFDFPGVNQWGSLYFSNILGVSVLANSLGSLHRGDPLVFVDSSPAFSRLVHDGGMAWNDASQATLNAVGGTSGANYALTKPLGSRGAIRLPAWMT